MKTISCPECKTAHTPSDWDRATEEEYGRECFSILEDKMDACWFKCPSCKKELEGKYFSIGMTE